MEMTAERVSEDSRPRAARRPQRDIRYRHDRFVLVASVLVIVMAFALEVVSEGRVAFRGFEQYPLPPTCYFQMLFDRGCPGCGLTRGFIHLANGRVAESLAVNRIAWIVALATLLQIPYRIAAMKSETGRPLGTRWPKAVLVALMLTMLANWCYSLVMAP